MSEQNHERRVEAFAERVRADLVRRAATRLDHHYEATKEPWGGEYARDEAHDDLVSYLLNRADTGDISAVDLSDIAYEAVNQAANEGR